MAAPTVGPYPLMMLTTPYGKPNELKRSERCHRECLCGGSPLTGGKPASLIKSHILKAVRGVNSLGFRTTTFPVAKAGPIFHENISMGNCSKGFSRGFTCQHLIYSCHLTV